MHGNTCHGEHGILYVEGTERTHDEPSTVYADACADTSNGQAVFLSAKANGRGVALILTDDEAITLAEQLLCSVNVARVNRAVAEAVAPLTPPF